MQHNTKAPLNFRIILSVYHLAFTVATILFVKQTVKLEDAEVFFDLAVNSPAEDLLRFGTPAMGLLLKPFVYMGLNFEVLTFCFSMISLSGFLILFNNLYRFGNENTGKLLSLLWLFLPSLHFWTSFIGKDAIFFTFACLLISSVLKRNFNSWALLIFALLSFFVRPHSTLVLGSITFVFYLYASKLSNTKKALIISLVSLLGIFVLYIIGTKFIGLNFTSGAENLIQDFNIQLKQSYSERGSHFLDPVETSYFEKIIAFMFRPLFFDAETKFQLIASLENLIIIIYLIILFGNNKIHSLLNLKTFYFLITAIALILVTSLYIFNFGQANRLRVMVIPFLFFGLCLAISLNKKNFNA